MTRGIWTKWIIGAACLLLIVAVGCFLWYQHITAQYKAEADKDDRLLQQWKANKATPAAETEATHTPAESTQNTAEKQSNEHTTESNNTTKNGNQNVTADMSSTQNEQPVRMSPFGFGPYPEEPEDYPYSVNWASNIVLDHGIEYELLTRVRIKLWTQGINAEGVTYGRGGLIYPVIRGVVYVTQSGDGNMSVELSHPDDHLGVFDAFWDAETPEEIDVANQREMEGLTIDDLPAGLTAVVYEDAGIDPYEFLDLPRR